ncbi:MAG: hypothetical protein ACXW4A_11795 [Nitrospira sp.]
MIDPVLDGAVVGRGIVSVKRALYASGIAFAHDATLDERIGQLNSPESSTRGL